MPPGTTFERATQVQPRGDGAYFADLKWDWSVGTGEAFFSYSQACEQQS